MFDYEVKQSYVVQEHADRWDANHKPIYSRTEENLDYGSEYTVESAYKIEPSNPIRWFMAVCKGLTSAISNTVGNTDLHGMSSPYTFLLIPGEDSGVLQSVTKASATSEATSSNLNDIRFFSGMMGAGLGEYVDQIVKIPYLPFNFTYGDGENGVVVIDTTTEENAYFSSARIRTGVDTNVREGAFIKIDSIESGYNYLKKLAEMGIFEGIESAMPTEEQWAKVTSNPFNTERDKRFESKLLTHPYRYNLLADWKGQPQTIKNEYIGGEKIKVNFTQGLVFNGPSRYWVEDYKKDPEGRGNSLTQPIAEDIPIINDVYYNYMLQNRNQITANQMNAITSSVTNVAGGLVSGIFGGVGGALLGSVVGGVQSAVNFQNIIRSENAKQKDLKNIPDTIVNSNDSSFNIMDKNEYLSFYRMKICCEFEELLADTFAMTGYTVKRMKLPNLKTRARYNYVKTIGANIVGSFDQNDLSLIKQIFDNGITFWHYNTINFKPFDYSLENIETKLIKG